MSLTVATYNVLADSYIHPSYYPQVPSGLLDPAWRQPALLEVMVALIDQGAQVLCLQEVEPALHERIARRLEPRGYRGVYAQKGAGRPDGCSTFFLDRFQLLADRVLRYADGGAGSADSGHLALLLTFAHLELQRPVTIANTHLRWEPESIPADQRLAARELVELLHELPPAPFIIGGDFNLRPESSVLDGLRRAGLVDSHANLHRGATCFANGRASTVDYLWHSPDLIATPMPIPPLLADQPLPSREQPSDHLPLCACFVAVP